MRSRTSIFGRQFEFLGLIKVLNSYQLASIATGIRTKNLTMQTQCKILHISINKAICLVPWTDTTLLAKERHVSKCLCMFVKYKIL